MFTIIALDTSLGISIECMFDFENQPLIVISSNTNVLRAANCGR